MAYLTVDAIEDLSIDDRAAAKALEEHIENVLIMAISTFDTSRIQSIDVPRIMIPILLIITARKTLQLYDGKDRQDIHHFFGRCSAQAMMLASREGFESGDTRSH